MYEVKFTSAYKKSYKLLKKRNWDISLLENVIEILQRGEKLDYKYHDHILIGKYRGFHECYIKPDWVLIYLIEEEVLTLTLIETGSHSDVLGM